MNRRFLGFRKQTLMMLMMFVSIILFSVFGCDRDTRYKILTFFFEGVPEPGAKRVGSDVNIVSMTNVQMMNLSQDQSGVVRPDKLGQRLASRHDFSRDCAKCHTGGLTSGHQELRAPLPDLCYSCHNDLHREGDYLHGPLSVGECVFCHDPHQSAFVHLQKAPEPDLCFRCHQKRDIVLIPGHREAMEGVCTDCHNPHASSVPKLLKVGQIRQGDRELMEELLKLQAEGDVYNPKLRSDTALSGVELNPDDPNTVH